MGIIRYLSSFTPVKTINEIYKLFVRPHFDYCDVISLVNKFHLTSIIFSVVSK